ncbi:MAG: nucleotidyltransferase family protein, partial [Thermoplasmataceae archaeon]
HMVMFIYKMKSPFGIVETLGDQVTSFKEKPFLDYFINAGVYYIKSSTKELFFAEYLNKDIETTVFPELARRKLIGAYREETFWMGIDSEKDLETVRKEYAGRVDYPWGYMRSTFSGKGISLITYYIKENSKMSIKIGTGSLIRFVKGEGVIHTTKDIIYGKNTVFDQPGNVDITGHKSTEFELISRSE